MIFVIQCAGSKADHAGVLRQKNGSPVMFVANPKEMRTTRSMSTRIRTIYMTPGYRGGSSYWTTTGTQETIL